MFIIKELIISALILVIGYLLVEKYDHSMGSEKITQIIFVVGYIIIQLIPSSILHFQYFRKNRKKKFFVDENSHLFTLTDEKSTSLIRFDQIKSIHIISSIALYRGGERGISAWELYHYAVIVMEDGRRFVITCILVNNLKNFFGNFKLQVTKHWNFYPLINTEWE